MKPAALVRGFACAALVFAAGAAGIAIRPAVELSFPVAPDRVTLLEQSGDLARWVARETLPPAPGANLVRYVPAAAGGPFFRVREQSFSNVTALLEPIRAQRNVPALVAAAIRSNVVVAAGATGLRKFGLAETPAMLGDRFHLGSCTKSMTATLAAILVQEGVVTWDTTVGAALPDLEPGMHASWKGVTLDLLLRNRGGAPGNLAAPLWNRLWTNHVSPQSQRRYLVQEVTKVAPETTPGSTYTYSNAGFAIAGHMLERATGRPWEELITERLFQPLGLDSAGFGPPASPRIVDQPWGHTWNARPVPVEPGTAADNPPAIGPAGTVHMTVLDFARYAAAHVRGVRDGLPFLARAGWEKLHDNEQFPSDNYAMGWGVAQRPWGGGRVLTHNGSNNQWFAVMWIAPNKDFAVVAITNTAGAAGSGATDDAVWALIQRFAN
ncbi:MAG TPA: serine hydrolase domain-containing protein [Verrucomicrobiota bacterium]|nr:serine hydrolase domain-containing protein [Verrucomicrobiota bacterium]